MLYNNRKRNKDISIIFEEDRVKGVIRYKNKVNKKYKDVDINTINKFQLDITSMNNKMDILNENMFKTSDVLFMDIVSYGNILEGLQKEIKELSIKVNKIFE